MSQQPVHIVGIGGTLKNPSNSLRALRFALDAATSYGATIDLLDLRQLDLPMYDPDRELNDYPPQVVRFVRALHRADGLLISTAAYHGTLAGVTKNALDYLEFLSDHPRPYLLNKPVGLIATAGGDLADVNSINALVHVVHSLRGLALPLSVPIHNASKAFDADGQIVNDKVRTRLSQLGKLVVETAEQMRPEPDNAEV
ncbi:MAG: NAD(P)H-dependent oxidoreductase [Anaerolineae bacterium]|nr:NAD(P)H-dependent oxidoreductase [Anaerolineae bacterium]